MFVFSFKQKTIEGWALINDRGKILQAGVGDIENLTREEVFRIKTESYVRGGVEIVSCEIKLCPEKSRSVEALG